MTNSIESPLSVTGLGMSYGSASNSRQIFDEVSFDVAPHQIVCMVGPSGVGKTTLLRCLSGLQRPAAGSVRMAGQVVNGPPEGLAVVFQDYSRSLLPWLRTIDNVALPLRVAGVSKRERRERADMRLNDVGLRGFGEHYPWQLSGGMQQRVAIARALVNDPSILLMDEPFASVDAQTRFELEDLTLRLSAESGVAVLLVTHDIDEAVYLGDRVLVLSGTPATIVDDIAVALGSRDQITTRATPLFAELRSSVLREIRSKRVEAAR